VQLKRRLRNDSRRQDDGIQIVVQVWPTTAVTRVAAQPPPGAAFPPGAGATKIPPSRIGEKHVSAGPEALGAALQPTCGSRERNQVRVVGYRDQEVNILGDCEIRGALLPGS